MRFAANAPPEVKRISDGHKDDPALMQSCNGYATLLRFGRPSFTLDMARAKRAFERRLLLAQAEARPVEFFPDPVSCCEAAFRSAWTEMVDRAPSYARLAALETLRARAQSSRSPISKQRLVEAALNAVDRDFFLDIRFRGGGPPYHMVSDEGRIRYRGTDSGVPVDESIDRRVSRLRRRLGSASHLAFASIDEAIRAGLPDEPDSNWILAWEASWWAAWDAPGAAEARRAKDEGRYAVAEEMAASAAISACSEACRRAAAHAVQFAYTALVRSPRFASPEAVSYGVTYLLARRAGVAVNHATLAFGATHVEPCLAGVYLYFVTPAAILCAPWPKT